MDVYGERNPGRITSSKALTIPEFFVLLTRGEVHHARVYVSLTDKGKPGTFERWTGGFRISCDRLPACV